jgi:hypothetical protein
MGLVFSIVARVIVYMISNLVLYPINDGLMILLNPVMASHRTGTQLLPSAVRYLSHRTSISRTAPHRNELRYGAVRAVRSL